MNSLVSGFRYRPEIDGLRAVAVMAVVLFHAGLNVPGGYIGVDVFFVISGFLITSLIIKDLETDKFSLSNFWERRARRILPAMVVMVVVTLAAGWFLLLPSDYANLGRSAAWQSAFAANIYYYLATGYFTGTAEEKPLLHTWSLAVEEQFYMVVPLLLLGAFHFSVFRRRGILLSLIAAGIAVSLVASIYGVARHPAAAFYLLPTRAWELLCGAFVALGPVAWIPRSRALREGLSLLGLAGILLPCWLYTKESLFPGIAAVPPCFGTALFIWACTNHQDVATANPLMATRLLSLRPIVFIGLISYSLYLWHWPICAYSTYFWFWEPMSFGYRLGMVSVSFVLAVLSWRYVETPFRKRQFCANRPAMLAFGMVTIAVIFALGNTVLLAHGFPTRLPSKAIRYASAKEDMEGIYELTAEDIRVGRLAIIGNPNPKAPVSLLLWGDSHAMAASPALDQFLKENGLAGRQATASATAPVLEGYWRSEFTNAKEVKDFNDAVFNYIKQQQIPNVILIGYWENYTDDKGTVPVDSALLSTIHRLIAVGARPFLMLQIPHQRFDVPKALAIAKFLGRDLTPGLARPTGWNGVHGNGALMLKRIKAAGGRILDPRPWFMDSTKRHFIVEKNGVSLYRDQGHLSATGAKTILLPFLRAAFNLPAKHNVSDGERAALKDIHNDVIGFKPGSWPGTSQIRLQK